MDSKAITHTNNDRAKESTFTSSTAANREGFKVTSQFVDNRQATTDLRNLQTMADGSPNLRQLRALQALSARGTPKQLTASSNAAEKNVAQLHGGERVLQLVGEKDRAFARSLATDDAALDGDELAGAELNEPRYKMILALMQNHSHEDIEGVLGKPGTPSALRALSTSAEIASAFIAHIKALGTVPQAQRAAAFAVGDAAILTASLTTLRDLAKDAGDGKFTANLVDDLPQAKLNALLREHANLRTVHARVNAVQVVNGAADADIAGQRLLALRGYGYAEGFKDYSVARGDAARTGLVEARKQTLREAAEANRNNALIANNANAFTAIGKRAQKDLGGDANTAANKPEPLSGKDAFNKAKNKFITARAGLARDKIAEINVELAAGEDHVDMVEGPEEEARVQALYKDYFASVDFHPKAQIALDAAEEDIGLAKSLIGALALTPNTAQLCLSGIPKLKIGRILAQANWVELRLNTGVDEQAVKHFAENEDRFALLKSLHDGNANVAKTNALAASLSVYAKYIRTPGGRAAFTLLIAGDSLAAVKSLLGIALGNDDLRAELVQRIRIKAVSAEDLTQSLQICARLRFDENGTRACFAALANGRTLNQLKEGICKYHLGLHNKSPGLSTWLDEVGALIDLGLATIVTVGDWTRLGGTPLTDERNYQVNEIISGDSIGNFCVHFHPDAQNAGIGHALDSKSHFKPARGGNVRVHYGGAVPASVRNLTSSRPPRP